MSNMLKKKNSRKPTIEMHSPSKQPNTSSPSAHLVGIFFTLLRLASPACRKMMDVAVGRWKPTSVIIFLRMSQTFQCSLIEQSNTYVIQFPEGMWWHSTQGLQGLPEGIPPTQPYAIQLDDYVVHIQANPGDFGVFHLHNVDPSECIRSLWQDRLLPLCTTATKWEEMSFDEENITLVPNANSNVDLADEDEAKSEHHFVLIYENHQAHVFQAFPDESIGHLRSRVPGLAKDLFDHRNKVDDSRLIAENLVLFPFATSMPDEALRSFPWGILGEVTPQFRILPDTDVLTVTLQGLEHQLEKILPIWRLAFQEDWQQQHGRTLNLQWMGDQACQMAFCPMMNPSESSISATPVEILQRLLPRRLLDVGLQIMEDECDGLIPLLIKHEDHVVGQLLAEDDWYFEDLYCLLQHAFKPIFDGAAPRVVAYGKPVGGECSAADLLSTIGLALHRIAETSWSATLSIHYGEEDHLWGTRMPTDRRSKHNLLLYALNMDSVFLKSLRLWTS